MPRKSNKNFLKSFSLSVSVIADHRPEFAGGEGAEGGQAGGEVLAGQFALAVEASEKVGGGEVALA